MSAALQPDSSVAQLLALLDLEAIEVNIFRGISPQDRTQRVFGGQVLGQALVAASRTVEDRLCHSLHAYFLLPGDPKVPILYEVDRSRDGRSLSSRRVVAIQHGRPIFHMSVSFQVEEAGLEHQIDPPSVPPPEELPTEEEFRQSMADRVPVQYREHFLRQRPHRAQAGGSPRHLASGTAAAPPGGLGADHRSAAGRSGAPPMRVGLRVRHDAAGHRAAAACHQLVFRRHPDGQHRPRDVVSPALPRRRLVALCAGQSKRVRRSAASTAA